MGMFAETAIVNYRLSFVHQVKKTSYFHLCLQQTIVSLRFMFSNSSKQKEVDIFHFKWKTETQVIFLNPFTPLCSSCKRKFVVYPFVDKEGTYKNICSLMQDGTGGMNIAEKLPEMQTKRSQNMTGNKLIVSNFR